MISFSNNFLTVYGRVAKRLVGGIPGTQADVIQDSAKEISVLLVFLSVF